MPSIAIIGPGAIGGVAAAGAAQAARHDIVICANQPFSQLTVQQPDGVELYSGPASVITDPAKARPVDWVFLAVKSHQTASAAAWLRALVGPNTRLAVMQNGVEHRERVASYIPASAPVVPVILQLPSERTAPGRVTLSGPALMVVPDDAAGQEFVGLFGEGIVQARTDADFVTTAFQKLCMNCPSGAISALTLRADAVEKSDALKELTRAMIAECMAVGRAEGAVFKADYAEKLLAFLARTANRGNSMYFDRRDGKALEWDARNAVVQRLGRKHGIATPVSDVIVPLLQALDPA